jgi:membrane protease YdiL (CAAX protease family)
MTPRIISHVLGAFCATSVFLGTCLQANEGEGNALLHTSPLSEEIVSLDLNTLGTPSMMPEEIGISLPPLEPKRPKNTAIAVGLSAVFPGLGHLYLGEMETASGLLGSAGLGVAGIRLGELSSSNDWAYSAGAMTVQTAWSYGLYAAYRDVRAHNGLQYSYKMPTDTFLDLTAAPFSWSVIKKPEVWGGVLGSLVVATGVGYLTLQHKKKWSGSASVRESISPVFAFPIGIGEEALFRGFAQSILSEWLTPWGGIAVSSALFGAAHIPNAWGASARSQRAYYSIVIPWLTLFGVYDGWLTYKNRSMKESVAIHAWYDFILLLGAAAGQAAIGKRADLSMHLTF